MWLFQICRHKIVIYMHTSPILCRMNVTWVEKKTFISMYTLGKPQKVLFCVPTTKALTTNPSSLVAIFLVRLLNKNYFFVASLTHYTAASNNIKWLIFLLSYPTSAEQRRTWTAEIKYTVYLLMHGRFYRPQNKSALIGGKTKFLDFISRN